MAEQEVANTLSLREKFLTDDGDGASMANDPGDAVGKEIFDPPKLRAAPWITEEEIDEYELATLTKEGSRVLRDDVSLIDTLKGVEQFKAQLERLPVDAFIPASSDVVFPTLSTISGCRRRAGAPSQAAGR